MLCRSCARWLSVVIAVPGSVDNPSRCDRLCAEIGRDSDVITRSLVLPVSYDQPRATRAAVAAAVAAGFGHIVLALPAPYHRRRTVGHRQDHHHTPPLSA